MKCVFFVLLMLSCNSALAQELYEVVAKHLTVFAQPSIDAQKIGAKSEHDIVEVYSKADGWACIKLKNGSGFVDLYCIRQIDEDLPNPQLTVSSQIMSQSQAHQAVTLKAATDITIACSNDVKAKNVKIGDVVPFYVAHNVVVDGLVVIPVGTKVEGVVCEAVSASKEYFKIKKSGKGRIKVKVDKIALPNNLLIPIKEKIIEGVLKFHAIIGFRADIIPAGCETILTTSSDVIITVNQ